MQFPSFEHEESLWNKGFSRICGIDEVGRGCFAGPMVASGVIFPQNVGLPEGINDSKLVPAKKRQAFAKIIQELALEWVIVEIDVETINQKGLGFAQKESFKKVVAGLKTLPDFVLLDAYELEGFETSRQLALVRGDQISLSIAAASIIAKVYRDNLMDQFDGIYPGYGFAKHKGYGTKEHQMAIAKMGFCPLHRIKAFNLEKFAAPKADV